MKKDRVLQFLDRLSGLVLIAWMLAPVGFDPAANGGQGAVLFAYSLPVYFLKQVGGPLAYISFCVYLVPAFGLFKLSQFFIGKWTGEFDKPKTCENALSRIFLFSCMLYAVIMPLLYYGNKDSYYAKIPLLAYIIAGVCLALHIASVVQAHHNLNYSDPLYCEYRERRAQQRSEQRRSGRRDAKQRHASIVEVFFRIRAKLLLSFISIIVLSILALSVILLVSYRMTIIKAVGDGARNQVEQSAAIYKVNLGADLAMLEYMNRQNSLNEKSEFRFSSMTIYSNRRTEVYLYKLDPAHPPKFAVEFSTLAPDQISPASVPALKPDMVAPYSKATGSASFSDKVAGEIAFVAPITTKDRASGTLRDRLLGFSVITFKQEEILKPYVQIRGIVIMLAAVFIYLSIVIAYLVGNRIVNPLLFLRMNVRKISESLTDMIRGETRISASSLIFDDCVTSRDEIKALSGEIGDMVTVIRGIIPYISASTLKHAEKGEASSQQKDLAFLFTDIRGFTTLCEGMQPNEVVDILNHYLNMQTEIILSNHGDIDKFVGDEMMAVFDGPDKERNACRAAMQIRDAMSRETETRKKEGLPTVEIGIGINSGPVVFGSVGARERMDFTSIGDTVNLAARLEGANKAYGSKTIITEVVYGHIKEDFICRELDFIAVKGKTQPVRIYEIFVAKDEADQRALDIKKYFEAGLAAYRKMNWDKAKLAFTKNVENYQDAPSQVFLKRVAMFARKPPEDKWDGVFRMDVK
jgi:adenylate cyclase